MRVQGLPGALPGDRPAMRRPAMIRANCPGRPGGFGSHPGRMNRLRQCDSRRLRVGSHRFMRGRNWHGGASDLSWTCNNGRLLRGQRPLAQFAAFADRRSELMGPGSWSAIGLRRGTRIAQHEVAQSRHSRAKAVRSPLGPTPCPTRKRGILPNLLVALQLEQQDHGFRRPSRRAFCF